MSGMLSLAILALTAGSAPAAPPAPASIIAAWVRGHESARPRVSLWLNRDDVYSRGDQARVYFRSDDDAYVSVIRIDTDGRVRILFPIDPWEDNWARGGRTFEVLGRDRDEAFQVDDYPGVGYVFAIASQDPFNYDDIIRGDHWDYRAISDGRVRGDPYVAVSDIAERIAVEGAYDYDVTQYHVERHYDYPRFVCYDCHAYASWRYWDPYNNYCSRFRIVIYDDWYYYPYRRYSGGVVVVRPYRPGPRYVFKDFDNRNDYVTRVAQRPGFSPGASPDGDRRTIERDRGSADVGGRGAIPAPVGTRRRSPSGDRAAPSAEPSRSPERRTQPEAPRDRATPSREPRPDDASPRRRPSGRTESANLRDTEGGTSQPDGRRAPDASSPRGTDSPSAEPSRREPSRAEPSRSGSDRDRADPTRAEPSRRSEPSRSEPSRAEPSRRSEPPRGEPSRAEPSRSPPARSTGEPQLKRRRPN